MLARWCFVWRILGFGVLMAAASPVLAKPALPDDVQARLRADPAGFVEEASVIILGFGSEKGIDSSGLHQMIDVERAALRASALRRLGVADLDGDDEITLSEVRAMTSVASARVRGRTLRAFEQADGDGDGRLTRPESLAAAQTEAERLIKKRAGVILAVMAFDADGNGWVAVSELRDGVAAMLSAGQAASVGRRAQADPSPI